MDGRGSSQHAQVGAVACLNSGVSEKIPPLSWIIAFRRDGNDGSRSVIYCRFAATTNGADRRPELPLKAVSLNGITPMCEVSFLSFGGLLCESIRLSPNMYSIIGAGRARKRANPA